MEELEIIENKETREKLIERVDVLDKVKKVILLPYGDSITTEQVADYYEVGKEAIKSIIKRHKEELLSNGYSYMKKSEIILMVHNEPIEIPNRGTGIFTRRAILNVGMLLRDGKIAHQVRTRLREMAEKGINIANSIENIEYKGNINNLVYSKDGQAITTSKAITEVTGKEHFHI